MGPTIKIGGVSYRADELIALLEELIYNGEETEYEMDLYLDYQREGTSAFGQSKHAYALLCLLDDVAEEDN